jgi:hypothetical protein
MKFYKRGRYTYWSNADIFSRFIQKRAAFTLKNAEDFDKFRAETPKLECFIDKLQDIVMLPSDLVYSVRIYFKNRKGNTHVLDGGLNRGEWYDLVYRIPHCLFSELEKFIEKEKGLDVHEWEKTLPFNENWAVKPDDERYGKLTHQAIAAIEQQEIYDWWKANKDKKDVDFENEDTYLKEEEEMLIRLIKIRNSLWT